MDSLITLSSLSPTTHTNSSQEHISSPADVDPNGEGDDGDSLSPCQQSEAVSVDERVRRDFNFSNFYSLATWVMDGDEVSLEKLVALKHQWECRFPEPAMVRRLVPRFSSKITFLPRRSIVQSTADRVDIETQNLGNSQNSADGLEIGTQNLGNSQNSDDGVDIGTQNLGVVGNSQNSDVGNSSIRLPMGELTPPKNPKKCRRLQSTRGFPRYRKYLLKEEIIIKPTLAMVAHGSRRWQSTAVGYFLGRRPYFPQLEAFARANCKGLQQVLATANGFYFFQFKTLAFMEEVIEEGPWLFQGHPVVLQPWEQGMSLRQQKHMQVPVWIRIRHLPMVY
ncbi:UNVERIFIED_CONTAM: hypothetical protein Slati_2464500 [Sesamum latifolium]|uniref:DUF4283 domain-containing protein n=1 Tax=Sesamum latifolium TaxID=2727402 RepID=A0AAW2WHZ4_9LAMI